MGDPNWRPSRPNLNLTARQQRFRDNVPPFDGHYASLMDHINGYGGAYIDVKKLIEDCKKFQTIKTVITPERFGELLQALSPAGLLSYAKTTGEGRLRRLLIDRQIPVAALMHYGANFMGSFKGAGHQMWEHLITAKLNSQGAVSGGHDEKVFLKFIAKNGLKILTDETDPDVPQPPLPTDEVHKVRYGTYTITTLEETGPMGRPRRGGCKHRT